MAEEEEKSGRIVGAPHMQSVTHVRGFLIHRLIDVEYFYLNKRKTLPTARRPSAAGGSGLLFLECLVDVCQLSVDENEQYKQGVSCHLQSEVDLDHVETDDSTDQYQYAESKSEHASSYPYGNSSGCLISNIKYSIVAL